MTRSFDHAGYYETRFLLMLLGFAVAIYFARSRKDPGFLLMFLNGAFWQALLEWSLKMFGLRGPGYSLSVFGVSFHPTAAWVMQGFSEGGILCLMSYWFLDLHLKRWRPRLEVRLYLALCALIVVLACAVGVLARGQAITSPRPMFSPVSILILSYTIMTALLLVGLKGGRAFRYLSIYFVGSFIYVVLTFEPLHLLGARIISERVADGGFAAVSLGQQFWVMLYSHFAEVAGGKIHYFAVPYALGLLKLDAREPES